MLRWEEARLSVQRSMVMEIRLCPMIIIPLKMVRPYLHLRATGLCLSKQIGEGLLRPENPTLSRDNARLFFGVRLALLVLQFLVFCLSWSRNERIMASTRSCNWLLPMPEGPIKCPIWPQNSWYLLSEYINPRWPHVQQVRELSSEEAFHASF